LVHNSPRTYTDAQLQILRWQGAGQTFTALKTSSHNLKLPLFGLRKRKAGGCVKLAHPPLFFRGEQEPYIACVPNSRPSQSTPFQTYAIATT
jgi:hypothetical protein